MGYRATVLTTDRTTKTKAEAIAELLYRNGDIADEIIEILKQKAKGENNHGISK